DTGLRDRLRKSLGAAGQSPQNSTYIDRMTGAAQRASTALTSASLTSDPQERAQFKRQYEAARQDYDRACEEAARANPAQRDTILAQQREIDTTFDRLAQEASLPSTRPAPDPPAQQQAAAPAPPPPAAPDPNLFSTCGAPDRRGIQTCYEAGPSGYGCRKMLKQGGDSVWSEDQATCDSSAVLQQRNDYFNKLKAASNSQPQLFGDTDARLSAAWSQLSPQCKALFNGMLQGADTGDKEKATSSYGAMRAQCDSDLKRIAGLVDSDLPERILSARARGAMEKAMSGDPNRVIEGIADRGDGGSYDPGEVLEFALGLMNVLSGVAGMYTPMAHGASASYSGSVYHRAGAAHTYGQGAPYRPAPRNIPSDITGTGR
ncbi:MAG: hypothetical protein JOY81_01760, partial [Alphaproteobacteria bacterium]|nr:hypothetical protein [Alphaproteobacteria bacterium]